MRTFRLTTLWVSTLLSLTFVVSAVGPFGAAAENRVSDSMIYPMFRFYRGGAYTSLTQSTISQIFGDRIRPTTPESAYAQQLSKHFFELCLKNRMDPAFVLSLIQVESGFQSGIVSSAGAVGLMQVMPHTAKYVATRNKIKLPSGKGEITESLRDPFLNLTIGMTYLRELRDRYAGQSPYFHLAAYNLGPHRLDELRSRPNFQPNKTLHYFEEIMRGVAEYRRYGSQARAELSTMPTKPSALKIKRDGERKRTGSVNPA
jgi:hypothetical protein